MRDEKSGKTRIKFLFGIAVIVAAVYISFKYLIVYVWPFVIGVFIAVILEKKVIYLSDKLYIGLDKLLGWNKRITIKKVSGDCCNDYCIIDICCTAGTF